MPVFTYTNYLPPVSEIPAETLLDARTAVEAVIRQSWPDVDTRPGSFFGDNHVSQQAVGLAAQAIAAERLANDLDTNQLRQGVVYNCAVASAWLANFSLISRDGNPCRGLVRLTFLKSTFLAACIDNRFAMPRGIQFLEGTANVCRPVLSRPGIQENADFFILAPGYPPTSDITVEFNSVETADGTIVTDIPVTAVSVAADGASFLTDSTVVGLTDITANGTFTSGFPADTVKEVAARVPYLFHGSSLSDKAGAVGFVYREFPWAECVSACTNGDDEMTRAGNSSLFLLQEPCLDLHVRSGTLIQETVRVRLNKLAASGGDPEVKVFYAPISFLHAPVTLDSVACPDAPAMSVLEGIVPSAGTARMKVFSSGPSGFDPVKFIRTTKEMFAIGVRVHLDDLAAALRTDSDGDYIMVDVTYTYDPALAQVTALLESTSNTPIGVSLVVRGFYPIELDTLNVNYFRRAGTAIRAGTARAEILAGVSALGYPELFTYTQISDSMLFAGAAGLRDLEVVSHARASAAHRVINTRQPLPSPANNEDWLILLDETEDLGQTSGYYDLVTGNVYLWFAGNLVIVGQRNRRYLLKDANLFLKEVTS